VEADSGNTSALPLPPAVGNLSVTSFVTVMQGCDNFCAYCVVPYLRGREESRPPEIIIAEIEALVASGTREVTLLGQNVNSYGKKGGTWSFGRLLEQIGEIDGLKRIRFTTSHPRDLGNDIIDILSRGGKICNHLHLPVQSGSNRILAAMNRGYSREEYLDLVARLRGRCPDISITSDLIVGFPGEERQDFEDTLSLMNKVKFDGTFSFKYSERPQTAAANMEGKIAQDVKSARLAAVQDLQKQHTGEKNQAWVGRKVEVLVEGPSVNNPDELTGRTRENRIVNFAAPGHLVGSLHEVTITRAFLHSLRGENSHREGRQND
jgi:tRNA-2-methylthio-N6-dimethylallyladenosine synthase